MHLAHLFKISQSTVSRIFISWINFMYLKLGQINIWPSRKVLDESMPEAFKEKYPSTRVIIKYQKSLLCGRQGHFLELHIALDYM